MELESQSCQTACGYRSALSIQTFLTRSLHLKSRCCTLHTCRTDGTLSEGSSKQEQIPAFKMTEVDQDLANNNKYHFSVFFFVFHSLSPNPLPLSHALATKPRCFPSSSGYPEVREASLLQDSQVRNYCPLLILLLFFSLVL